MKLTRAVDIVIGSVALQANHPELFHYTRWPGFEAIIRSNTFWATHFLDLPDEHKLTVLKPLLLEMLAALFDDEVATRNRPTRNRYRHRGGAMPHAERFLASLFRSTFEKNDPSRAVDAFTTSFSTHSADSDFERENGLLSQWTRYAPDGFCIVLDTTAMCGLLGSEFDTRDFTHLNLEATRYAMGDIPLREHFTDLEPALRSAIEQHFRDDPNPEMGMIEFLRSATLLHVDFKEEREVRIVAIPGAPAYQKQAAKEHADYVVKPLPIIDPDPKRHITIFREAGVTLPIKRVIVGPSVHQAENAELARSLIAADRVVLSKLNTS